VWDIVFLSVWDIVMRQGVKKIQAGDLSIYTEHFGNIDHPACLLIAGAMATAHFWTDSFCSLLVKENFFIIRYDHRDIGESSVIDWQKNPYSLADLAADAIAILDGYGIKKAHCIGHSMGGYICQRMALDFPERVLTLTILSAAPICATADTDLPLTTEEKAIQEKTWDIMFSRKENSIEGFLPIWRYLNGTIPLDEKMASTYTQDLLTRSSSQIHPGNNHELVMRQLEIEKCRGLFEIQTPTLIIHGMSDPLSLPRNARALAKAIPHAKLEIISGMGHMFFNQELESKIAHLIIEHIK
jgi:pimeloyl-ACP methyl ester carboxylesterase